MPQNTVLYNQATHQIELGATSFFTGSTIMLLDSSSNAIEVVESTNNYSEINIQNISSTNTSSADLVATNDTGNNSSGYIDVGINASKYTASAANIIGQANDSYVYSLSSGNMYLGNASSGNLYLFSGTSINTSSGNFLDSNNIFHHNNYRAGQAAIGNLATTLNILFSSALPNSSYAATVGSDTVLASAVSINATGKTVTGFTASLSAGIAGGATLDYIAILNN